MGCSYFFNGVAIKELPTFTLVAGRVFLTSAILLVIVHAMGMRMPTARRLWLAFLGMALHR